MSRSLFDDLSAFDDYGLDRPQFPELRLNPKAEEFIPEPDTIRNKRYYKTHDWEQVNHYPYSRNCWEHYPYERSYQEPEFELQAPYPFKKSNHHKQRNRYQPHSVSQKYHTYQVINKFKRNPRNYLGVNVHKDKIFEEKIKRRCSNGSSSSSGSSSRNDEMLDRMKIGENTKNSRGSTRKYSYRSKQNKIDIVLASLRNRYQLDNKLADDDEVLRGKDTLRVDVKRYTALTRIEEIINEIELDRNFEILRVDFPVSQKNRFQKKGFIAYLKLRNHWQAKNLHKKLNMLMDPKYPDKTLFRVNIAIDQRSANSSASSTKETDTSSLTSSTSEGLGAPTCISSVEKIRKQVESITLQ